MAREVTMAMPLHPTPGMLKAVREDPTTKSETWEEWHTRLGWLVCAYEVMVAARGMEPKEDPTTDELLAMGLGPIMEMQPDRVALDPALVRKMWFETSPHIPHIPHTASLIDAFFAGVRAAEKAHRIPSAPVTLIRPGHCNKRLKASGHWVDESELCASCGMGPCTQVPAEPDHTRCNQRLIAEGKAHPRNCAECFPGVCKFNSWGAA